MAITLPRKRYIFAATAGLAILFYTLKQADLKRLMQGLAGLDPVWGVMAVAASILSYLCIAAVLHSLLKGMKHELSFSSSFKISLLSSTMNYVMAVGGLSGMAAKVYLLSKEKIPPSSTLSISMVHGFLTNTVAVVFIYLGFFYLYSEYKLSAREKDIGVLILMVAFALTWITIHAMISESFRKRLWRILDETGHRICGKLGRVCWFRQERAQTFFDRFN
ncbi:MAG: lysylphosphatidylglycerol synthase domain-containing protein, partial [Acidobacteriota bacterium]